MAGQKDIRPWRAGIGSSRQCKPALALYRSFHCGPQNLQSEIQNFLSYQPVGLRVSFNSRCCVLIKGSALKALATVWLSLAREFPDKNWGLFGFPTERGTTATAKERTRIRAARDCAQRHEMGRGR